MTAGWPAVDWQRFLALVNWHDVNIPVATAVRNELADLIPPPVQDEFRRREIRTRYWARLQLAELGRLLRALAAEGIAVWPLKGPLLSWQLFGRADYRRSADLDLLVQPKDLAATERLLFSSGYTRTCPPPTMTPRQWRFYTRFAHHTKYINPVLRQQVELHWCMAHPRLLPTDLAQAMLSRSRPVEFAGLTVPSMTMEDTAVHLLVHGAAHGWCQLKWLVDIAACLRRAPPLDWSAVGTTMAGAGLGRMLSQGLLLSRDLFEIPPPAGVDPALLRNPAAMSLAETAGNGLRSTEGARRFSGPDAGIGYLRYLGRLRVGWRYRWWAWNTVWFHERDWAQVALPDFLFPLYYPIRPVLWLWRNHLQPLLGRKDPRRTPRRP